MNLEKLSVERKVSKGRRWPNEADGLPVQLLETVAKALLSE